MLNRCIVFIALLLLGSCIDSSDYDINSVTITPTVSIPLASGDLSILDLVSDKDSAYIKTYPDGLLYFLYSNTYPFDNIRNMFNPADKTVNTSINLPSATIPPNGVDFRSDSIVQSIDLSMSPAQLNEMGFKSGTLNYTISTTPSLPSVNIAINLILTDVVDRTTLKPLNIMSGIGSGSRSLQNYKATLSSNRFNVRVVLIFKAHNNSEFIPPGSKANIQLSFAGMKSSYAKGFFGDQLVNLPAQTIDMSIFSSSLKKVNISFVQPTVKMSVISDNGVPTEVAFSTLEARKTGSVLPIQITPSSPVNLNYPSIFGTSALTTITVGNANALISFSPTQLYYSGSARINKGLVSGNNFLTDTSRLKVNITSEIPLYGKASGVGMFDTLKIDLGNLGESSINTAVMKISAQNQMPLDAYIQLYLTNENYGILDSLFSNSQTYLVKGSTVTAGGELQTAGNAASTIELSPAKITRLFSSSYLIIRTKLNTSKDANGSLLNVKFKSSYKLKMNVGLTAQLNLTVK